MSSDGDDLRALAGELAGEPVSRMERLRAGANSRVYQVVGESGRAYALKIYARDGRERMEREVEALEFLGQAGSAVVPPLLGADFARDAALFGWLEGEPVDPLEPRRPGDIPMLAAFLTVLHRLRVEPAAAGLRAAGQAVTSPEELRLQLRDRLDRLGAVAAAHAELRLVLDEIASELARRRLPAFSPLPRERQTLSPSDVGFHNAVRRRDGSLAFVDFEYFGWDDPVKLVSDVLWHPGHRLREGEAVEFRSLAAETYSVDPGYEVRFAAFYPFFGLRWALIVLNEFLPKERTRREFAGAAGDRRHIEELQLAKARDLVQRVRALPT